MAFIYKITNIINNKFYIGSTIRAKHIRKYEHMSSLRLNNHPNNYLQRSFNKYGEENIKFSIIEELKFPTNYSVEYINEYVLSREFYYVESLNPEYNIKRSIERGKTGYRHSEETRKKISESNKKVIKKPLTQDHKDKIGKAHLGKNPHNWSIESRNKASKSAIGRKHTEESKRKIGEATSRRYKKEVSNG